MIFWLTLALCASVVLNVILWLEMCDWRAAARDWKRIANLEFEVQAKKAKHDGFVLTRLYACPKCSGTHPLGQSCRYARKLASAKPN
jgi:hypothetical protein